VPVFEDEALLEDAALETAAVIKHAPGPKGNAS
jgi:hypothetical protein